MKLPLRLIAVLAHKDWQLFWADRRAALLCFAVPIMLASAFGLIFHRDPQASQTTRLPVALIVESPGPLTVEVLERLRQSGRVEAIDCTPAEAIRRVADRQPSVALEFPPEFESLAQWKPGEAMRPAAVRVRHHPLAAAEAQWAEGLISEAVMKTLAERQLRPWLPAGQANAATDLPFRVQAEPVVGDYERGFNAYTHSFNGMTLQYLLFWGMESGLLLLRERRRSLWLRMRAAPIPLGAMLCAKALATAVIAWLQVLVTFAFGAVAFGIRIEGSVVGFLLLALLAGALSAATGLLVATIGGTEARARSVCILAILGVSMVGGLWLPSFLLPSWARDLALTLPTTWAMRGLDAVTWQGRGLSEVSGHAAVLSGFTILFLGFAVLKWIATEQQRRSGGTSL